MLEELKARVCEANLDLVRRGLVIETWGNVSGIDRAAGKVVIKPSGLPYEGMKTEHMVVVDLSTGKAAPGGPFKNPSSDTPTHLELYRSLPDIGGIVHTHSLYATAWAQAHRDLPALGTTHADYFHGPVPCTRPMTVDEIRRDYEANTGRVIVERLRREFGVRSLEIEERKRESNIDRSTPNSELRTPNFAKACLVAGHGPFAWGATPEEAVENAAVLEYVARLAMETLRIAPDRSPIGEALLDKHFSRKHGPDRYYGQKKRS
jgi:L-ribulose-5-phosphate 4-epimerase